MSVAPLVIGIAGGTASGKTTVARRIVEGLSDAAGSVALLDLDSYYRDLSDLSLEEKKSFNWDHPEAFDADLLVSHLKALKVGRSVEKPTYSFSDYARGPGSVTVNPAAVVLVEGILVLALEAIRKECEVRLFVDADDDVRVIRRLMRDVKERGRELDQVVEQYFRTVRPMHLGFVEPSKRHADIIIPHGGANETAIRMVVGALRGRLAEKKLPAA